MGTIRLPICVAIMLLAVPQAGQAQDTFNSTSGAAPSMGAGQALRCAEERLKHYADEPFKQPSVCPPLTPSDTTPGTSGGVLLKGGVGVEENGKRPAVPGPGSAPMLKGGVSQGQQGTSGYPPPAASSQPVGRQPVFAGSTKIDKAIYTIRSEGPPGGAGWGDFENAGRVYESFYGWVERRGPGYIFRITKLRLPDGRTKAANIAVPVKKVQ